MHNKLLLLQKRTQNTQCHVIQLDARVYYCFIEFIIVTVKRSDSAGEDESIITPDELVTVHGLAIHTLPYNDYNVLVHYSSVS